MAIKVTLALTLLAAIAMGVAPDAGMGGHMSAALAVLGIIYAALLVDPDDATPHLVLAIAIGGAANADVLGHIPMAGMALDGILDGISIAAWGGVVTVIARRIVNRFTA